MTDTVITGGAPQIVLRGTKDSSPTQVSRARANVPTHLPLCLFYARRGRTAKQLINDSDISAQYHTDTFDPRKQWYNHATVFAQGFLGRGNAIVAQRVKPTDAGPIANVTLCLEVLKTKVDDFERLADGSIKTTPDGDPIALATKITGHRVRWVVKHNTGAQADAQFGAETVKAGTLTDADELSPAQIYPIFSAREASFGSDGNLTGIRIFAPSAVGLGEKFDSRLLKQIKTYPFRFSVLRQNEANQSYRVEETLSGAQSVLASFKPGSIDPNTDADLSADAALVSSYHRVNHTTLPDVDGFMQDVAIYQSNIELLLAQFKAAEDAYVAAATDPDLIPTDFSGAAGENYLFNFLGGTTYSGYPYHTYVMEPSTEGYAPGPSSILPFGGGSDGTMNNAAFGALVVAEIQQYANRNSRNLEDAIRVESVFYDSGFALADKYKLMDFVALRKDLAVMFSTHEADAPSSDLVASNATATALYSRAELYPESTFYGTGPVRFFIVADDAKAVTSAYRKRVPLLYTFAMKFADYMGAGSGKWNGDKNPTGAPGSIVTDVTDISQTFRPVDQKVLDWNVGLNYVQAFDTNSYHIPAYKTIYRDDTSVLTSVFTMFAIIEINKVCQAVHRQFSGVDKLSNLQLADKIDKAVAARLQGRFDNRFYIEVETTFTEQDVKRNYSWTTAVRIGAYGQKTVMQAYVDAYRREVLEGQA